MTTGDSNKDQSYISKRTLKSFDTEKQKGKYIFASYSHKDADDVMPELQRFHDNGYNIWYDEGIVGGTKWKEYIGKNLIGSSLFIVFLSPNSMASDNVKTEIAIAKDAGIPIIPFYLEFMELDLDLKYDLILYQAIIKSEMSPQQYDQSWKRAFEKYISKSPDFEEEDSSAVDETQDPNPDVEEKDTSHLKQTKSFRYLDELIQGAGKTISLESDITLAEAEDADYRDGILIAGDDIVIEGNNHSIDANGLCRIFNVTGRNVSIRNLEFRGGYAFNASGEKHKFGGGAIHVGDSASLNLFNCRFSQNYSESDGGALFNRGESSAESCVFTKNSCKTSGGAVSNFKSLAMTKSKFDENESVNGGAVYNYHDSTLTLLDCKFKANRGLMFAGGIYNYSDLKIEGGIFRNNISEIGGGAVLNYGLCRMSDTVFIRNSSDFGGAVFNMSLDKLNIYSYDSSNFGGKYGSIIFDICSFANNDAGKFGGAICNLSKCKLVNSEFGNNSAGILGNLISNGPEGILNQDADVVLDNQYLSILDLSDCDVKIKQATLNNAIYNQKNCLLKVSSNMEVNNRIQDSTSEIFLNNGKLDFY